MTTTAVRLLLVAGATEGVLVPFRAPRAAAAPRMSESVAAAVGITPIGPFSPFRSRTCERGGMLDADFAKLNSMSPSFMSDLMRLQLAMQAGEPVDPAKVRQVADDMQRAQSEWEATLTRSESPGAEPSCLDQCPHAWLAHIRPAPTHAVGAAAAAIGHTPDSCGARRCAAAARLQCSADCSRVRAAGGVLSAWRRALPAVAMTDDFQAREYRKMTAAHLERQGQSFETMGKMIGWQARTVPLPVGRSGPGPRA